MHKILFISLITFLSVFLGDDERHKIIAYGNSTDDLINRDVLIEFAKDYIGSPYRYGGSNPEKGFDCSGFVRFVFQNYNIELPHSSRDFKNIGKELKPEDFKVGDILVFYGYQNTTTIGHVGIICEANGMQSKFIHSSSGKVKGVTISELGSDMYTRRFYKCVDVIGGMKY